MSTWIDRYIPDAVERVRKRNEQIAAKREQEEPVTRERRQAMNEWLDKYLLPLAGAYPQLGWEWDANIETGDIEISIGGSPLMIVMVSAHLTATGKYEPSIGMEFLRSTTTTSGAILKLTTPYQFSEERLGNYLAEFLVD